MLVFDGELYRARNIGTGQQLSRLDLYVSDVNGDDTNDGLSPATALKTIGAVVGKIPFVTEHAVVVHVGKHSGAGYTWSTFGPHVNKSRVWVIGDGAGQSGEDGFTELKASSVAASGTDRNKVVSSGLGVNAFRGKTVEILSGTARGDRRTVRDNTATDINVCVKFTSGIAAGDSFRVVEPEVDIATHDSIPIAQGISPTRGPTSAVFPSPNFFGLVNFKFDDTLATLNCHGTDVVLCGIEADGFAPYVSSGAGFVGMGISDTSSIAVYRVVNDEFSDTAPNPTSWYGWGLNAPTVGPVLSMGNMMGVIVGNSLSVFDGCQLKMFGGNIHTAGATIQGIGGYAYSALTVDSLSGQMLNVLINNDSGVGLTLTNHAFAFVTNLTVTGSTTGIRVDNASWARLSSSCTFDGAAGFGALAYRGGRILYSSSGTLAGTTGSTADLSVDNSTGVADTALATTDSTHPAVTARPDNSVIQRIF